VPTTLVAKDLAEGRLVRPFGDDLAYDFAYYVVHRPQADEAPGVAAFKTWLLGEAHKKSSSASAPDDLSEGPQH
jgi:LysR family glycine cleavage system transcriptional activator